MKLALFDMGSNSVRLLLGEYKNAKWHNENKTLWTTRLGEKNGDSNLTSLAKQKTKEALLEGIELAKKYGASEFKALATGAVREADNGKDFAKEVYDELGVKVTILNGQEEANIGFVGAMQDKKDDGSYVMVDIGGATTEIAIGTKEKLEFLESYKVGAVRMQSLSELSKDAIKDECRKIWPDLNEYQPLKIVGIGGTFTSLAAMDLKLKVYDPKKVHGHVITRKWINKIQNTIREFSLAERKNIVGLSPKRAEIIVAGIDIVASLMDFYNIDEIEVSEKDGLEGAQELIVSSLRLSDEKEKTDAEKIYTENLEQRVLHTIKKHDMIKPNAKILVACSAGPDSMSLLHILKKYADRWNIELGAVCLDHGIRIQGWAEVELLKTYCENNGVRFHTFYDDIPRRSEEEKLSTETAGRKVRYGVFAKLIVEYGYTNIALGHHKGDQAETVLAHLIRGAGLTGLRGMEYTYGNKIRPLLDVRKEELLQYAIAEKISYAWDHTNDELEYERNKLRLEIIPQLEKLNPQVVDALSRLGELATLDDRFLEKLAKKSLLETFIEQNISENGDINSLVLDKKLFAENEKALRFRMWREVCKNFFPFGAMPSLQNIESMDELLFLQGNKQFLLKWMKICVQYDRIYITKFYNEDNNKIANKIGKNTDEFTKRVTIDCRIIEEMPDTILPGTFVIPKTIVDEAIIVRTRKAGDKIILRDKEGNIIGHKKLKKYLIDKKIPVEQRDKIEWITIGSIILCEAKKDIKYYLRDLTAREYILGFIQEEYND